MGMGEILQVFKGGEAELLPAVERKWTSSDGPRRDLDKAVAGGGGGHITRTGEVDEFGQTRIDNANHAMPPHRDRGIDR